MCLCYFTTEKFSILAELSPNSFFWFLLPWLPSRSIANWSTTSNREFDLVTDLIILFSLSLKHNPIQLWNTLIRHWHNCSRACWSCHWVNKFPYFDYLKHFTSLQHKIRDFNSLLIVFHFITLTSHIIKYLNLINSMYVTLSLILKKLTDF